MVNQKRWKEHTRLLPLLFVGDHVRIQNQVGNHAKKWNCYQSMYINTTNSYVIRVNGSGKITIGNRKFLLYYTLT